MKIEIRGDQVLLDGYINVVDRESRILPSPRGRFKEKIVPKTFQRALDKADNVDLLFNHDKSRKLGSTSEGNIELYEDNIGLRGIATVSDGEVIQKAKSGELRGWSFGFVSNKDRWEDGEDGIQHRHVEDIDLLEVSILSKTPAYIATSIESRGEESVITEQRNDDFKAEIVDLTKENKEEKREVDYSIHEKQIQTLKLRG